MTQQDLVHKRPFLFISLAFGLSYPLSNLINLPDILIIIWKMAAVGCLALYALRNHSHGSFLILASFLSVYALGDGFVEFDILWGGIAFAIGHIIAILFFLKYRRPSLSFSQKLLVFTLPIITPLIAYMITNTAEESGLDAAIYIALLAMMASAAWASSFPRYRTGLGTILFIISDLLLFLRFGLSPDIFWLNLMVWYSYYFGVFLMATGIVQTLRKKGS